ncbi:MULTISPECIES: hypothetical protein [Winogradskyella]|uniref:hypothetical protein n=1 Tax=Winogradskyella TaxID=286104 RepID=UPI0015C6ED79|nr:MULTISPECIES: hypothetical protein [Winogradskyella]QXP78765.1 hypothetical protein H0I32_16410 [Winogradskyella sp. HaHa_3_26]
MRIIFIILLNSLILVSCGNQNKDKKAEIKLEKNEVETKSLLDNVKLAVNPKFKDWVLFENGTYIIFDDITQIDNIESEAIRLMKEFGPVHAGGPAGDFNVISLNQTEGWVVSGHGYGMYTYVNPSELESNSPEDLTIGIYGRSKRNSDGQNPNIIYVNSSKNN